MEKEMAVVVVTCLKVVVAVRKVEVVALEVENVMVMSISLLRRCRDRKTSSRRGKEKEM